MKGIHPFANDSRPYPSVSPRLRVSHRGLYPLVNFRCKARCRFQSKPEVSRPLQPDFFSLDKAVAYSHYDSGAAGFHPYRKARNTQTTHFIVSRKMVAKFNRIKFVDVGAGLAVIESRRPISLGPARREGLRRNFRASTSSDPRVPAEGGLPERRTKADPRPPRQRPAATFLRATA